MWRQTGRTDLVLYLAVASDHITDMAILQLALMGNPILAGQAAMVEDPCDPVLVPLVADMIETMEAAGGIGLAAPQIGRSLQLVIFRVPGSRSADGEGLPLTVLMNPEITPLDETMEEGYEGCLSVPGLTGLVPRWRNIAYRGLAPDGSVIERQASGFHARVVQHECDHLWGRLYLSRMTDLSTLAYTEELARLARSSEDAENVGGDAPPRLLENPDD